MKSPLSRPNYLLIIDNTDIRSRDNRAHRTHSLNDERYSSLYRVLQHFATSLKAKKDYSLLFIRSHYCSSWHLL